MDHQLLDLLATASLIPLYFFGVPYLNKQAAEAGVQRRAWILENPHTLTWVQLVQSDGYDAHIVVRTYEDNRESLYGFSGETAVRKFQELCACSPKAAHIVTTNGVNHVLATCRS